MLLILIKKTFSFSDLTFFKDERKNPQVYFTNLLFHFLLAGLSNNHGITAYTEKTFVKESYASAIFPKVACLLNHSCNPNTSVVCQKDIQITFATRTILKDEEICHIYNCHFADTPLEVRQSEMLKNYHFNCTCTACVEDYKMYKDMPEDFDDKDYLEAGQKVLMAFQEKDFKEAGNFLVKKLTIASEKLKEPHKLLITDRAALTECLTQQYGNKSFMECVGQSTGSSHNIGMLYK